MKKHYYYVTAFIIGRITNSMSKKSYSLTLTQDEHQKDDDFFPKVPDLLEDQIKELLMKKDKTKVSPMIYELKIYRLN